MGLNAGGSGAEENFLESGFVSQQVTSEKLLWELCWMIFLRLMP
jgi:hypothetical protein